jgi:hypothetical protein
LEKATAGEESMRLPEGLSIRRIGASRRQPLLFHRRQLLSALALSASSMFLTKRGWSQAPGFDAAFQALLADQDLLDRTRALGGDRQELATSRGTVTSRTKSDRKISQKAIDLIVAFEVSSKDIYQRKYQGVTRPGGASGITIGIGYDVGYVSVANLKEDWAGYMSDSDIALLSRACGVTGSRANALLRPLSSIRIPWDPAYTQFLKNVVPVYVAATLNSLPNANVLSDDSLGALVSLVYNRGPSFELSGDRYSEMRAIKRLCIIKSFKTIGDQIEHMSRLWTTPDVIGVARRRHLEKLLYNEGNPP